MVETAEKSGYRFSPSKTKCVHICRRRKHHDDPCILIKGRRIECQSTVKFLGLTFDCKLTWLPHITNIVHICRKILILIRCVTSCTWGADRETLLKIHQSLLVLSRVNYGFVIYSSAGRSRLKLLDTIHCAGIRLAIGAFRTSPLYRFSWNLLPLSIMRKRALINYGTHILAQPNHSNYKLFCGENTLAIYHSRPTITRPASIRFLE